MCAHVAEGEANDRGLVQVSLDGGLQRQQPTQVCKDVGLHPPSLSGGLAAHRPAEDRCQERASKTSHVTSLEQDFL